MTPSTLELPVASSRVDSRDLCRDFSLHNHGDSCFMPCFVWEMPVLVLNLLT